MKKIIFLDIDGTLIHTQQPQKNGLQISGEKTWIFEESIAILNDLFVTSIVCLITGRRFEGYNRLRLIVPHHAAMIEHGSVLYEDGQKDHEWASFLKEYIGTSDHQVDAPMWQCEQRILQLGYETDSRNREGSFRIKIPTPSSIPSDVEHVLKQFPSLTTTMNNEQLDVLPVTGGKLNAAQFICNKYDVALNESIALGNDYNDLSLLEVAKFPITYMDTPQVVRDCAQRGYISPLLSHEATVDMLNKALELATTA